MAADDLLWWGGPALWWSGGPSPWSGVGGCVCHRTDCDMKRVRRTTVASPTPALSSSDQMQECPSSEETNTQAAHVPERVADHPARPRPRHPRQAHPACHTAAAPQPYPHHQPPSSSPSGADLVCSTCP
ncbi:hypothetical protein PIB30_062746 [Stylosanthes scabra]|uniref:Uncharacterized protein n=1 Tax=Stylosanthes scabra TaxID=79078 RepID=A0ABU6QKQ5_9FABA|nr:hypothetical protein [Stylosanthes scabra]